MKKPKKFSKSFKRQVVLEVLSGKISKDGARRRYNIAGKSTVLGWMRTYAGLKTHSPGTDPIPILQNMEQYKSTDREKLEARIKELESKLENAELRGRAYQIMVETAKEKYNLDLEKKPGAKQSKNSNQSGQK